MSTVTKTRPNPKTSRSSNRSDNKRTIVSDETPPSTSQSSKQSDAKRTLLSAQTPQARIEEFPTPEGRLPDYAQRLLDTTEFRTSSSASRPGAKFSSDV